MGVGGMGLQAQSYAFLAKRARTAAKKATAARRRLGIRIKKGAPATLEDRAAGALVWYCRLNCQPSVFKKQTH